MSLKDKLLLRKRAIIETVNDQLKNISQIEHTRHRSPQNFLINLLSGIAAVNVHLPTPKSAFKIHLTKKSLEKQVVNSLFSSS